MSDKPMSSQNYAVYRNRNRRSKLSKHPCNVTLRSQSSHEPSGMIYSRPFLPSIKRKEIKYTRKVSRSPGQLRCSRYFAFHHFTIITGRCFQSFANVALHSVSNTQPLCAGHAKVESNNHWR